MNNSELQSRDVPTAGSDASANQPKRDAGSSISDPVMRIGRDEMNLAEFPLAGLASRPTKGATSLVFEDRVWDKGQRQWINKKLAVVASTEFGLPTALDDEVILGLIQMTYATRFENREVVFVPADLFRVLGWRGEGRDYSRLEGSLNRWMAVTLYCDNAWWDAELQEWMDDRFQILDRFINPNRKRATKRKRRLPWTIVWSEKVFKSFRDGYIRKLDMGVYRQLKSSAAKRMLRFLDKRFHFKNHLIFDLRTFACERVGFNRNDDNSQLKRRLARAINELEAVGYLKPLPRAERFKKVRRGKWEVAFVKSPEYSKKEPRLKSPLENVLVDRGINEPTAARLVRTRSPETIRECVREHDELLRSGRGANLGNPPGLLINNIREHCASKNAGHNKKHSADTWRETVPPTEIEAADSDAAESDVQLEAVRKYLEKMSPKERECLEAGALKQARPFQIKCYEQARRDGDHRSADRYRDIIVHFHVRDLLVQMKSKP